MSNLNDLDKVTDVTDKVVDKVTEINQEIKTVSEETKIPVKWFYIGAAVAAAVVLHLFGIL